MDCYPASRVAFDLPELKIEGDSARIAVDCFSNINFDLIVLKLLLSFVLFQVVLWLRDLLSLYSQKVLRGTYMYILWFHKVSAYSLILALIV